MKVPLSWLKEYVPVTAPPEELAHRLTMAGLEVAAIERIGGDWDRDKVFVGSVTAVVPHPNADRLTLATVDLGTETWTVVCGAPNVAAGQKVPFAKEGTLLIDPRTGKPETLKAATIRGVESRGMVCSERELGLGEDHTGIVVLPQDAPVGTPLADYLGDVVLDVKVTANRPDCLSVLGIAHEVAALTGQQVTEPDLAYPEEGEPIESRCHIEVADPHLCSRYTASLIEDCTIGPSPAWLQDRLTRAGLRPINNVVDVTNYVMLEYGQPLHAFDFALVRDRTIIVRAARPGEKLIALDGTEYTLQPPMLTIADSQDAVGLAGVMGGANSEMTDASTAVLLESATFDAINTRRTESGLHLRTEASTRFEKGLSPELAPRALRRATQLILELAGGRAARGIIDLYPGRPERPPITLTADKVRRVLGVELSPEQVHSVLSSLGFRIEEQDATTLQVTPPYWRTDVTIPEDVVEEVARIVGYDQIPTTTLSGAVPQWRPQLGRVLQEQVRDILVACGLQETMSYTLTSREHLERVAALRDEVTPLKVANPMSAAQEYLRTTLRASILGTLAADRRHTQEDIRIFELGRVYLPRHNDLPQERQSLIALFSGPREVASWLTDQGFHDAKGVLEALLEELGVAATFQPLPDDSTLHPGRTAAVRTQEGHTVGTIGEVHPQVLDAFDLADSAVGLFELDLEALLQALPGSPRRYHAIPRFPGALRDLAIVVDAATAAGRVLELVQRHRLVAKAILFDVYQGEGIPEGKKSLAISVLFQAPDRTLTSEEIAKALEQILRSLEREVGAALRG